MPYQSTLQLSGVSPETVDQLLTDPSHARDLIIDSIPELLTHIAGRSRRSRHLKARCCR